MDRYAILLDGTNVILDMQIVQTIPSGYIEISTFQWHELFYNRKPWTKYVGGVFVNDLKDEEDFVMQQNIRILRQQMKDIQAEIRLNVFLNEDTTRLEDELSNLKTQYANLVTQ